MKAETKEKLESILQKLDDPKEALLELIDVVYPLGESLEVKYAVMSFMDEYTKRYVAKELGISAEQAKEKLGVLKRKEMRHASPELREQHSDLADPLYKIVFAFRSDDFTEKDVQAKKQYGWKFSIQEDIADYIVGIDDFHKLKRPEWVESIIGPARSE